MHTLENELMKVVIANHGAELQSIWLKKEEKELLWQGDDLFWGRKAPVLFPFVGKLKDDCFNYDGSTYPMGQHGFARDRVFELVHKDNTKLTFSLKSDTESRKIYPFEFELQISFALNANKLTTNYQVLNPADKPIYFSIGAHPGFNLAVNTLGELDNVVLQFEQAELLERYLLDSGLFSGKTELMAPTSQNELPLTHGLFAKDAIIFKSLKSKNMRLLQNEKEVLTMQFEGFPFMGIWTKAGAPYICLEPWCGLADDTTGQEDIRSKEGIESLDARKEFNRSFTISTPL